MMIAKSKFMWSHALLMLLYFKRYSDTVIAAMRGRNTVGVVLNPFEFVFTLSPPPTMKLL